MEQYAIALTPYGKQSVTVNLSKKSGRHTPIEQIIEKANEAYSIFSDLSYEIQLVGPQLSNVQNVLFYVNDCFEQCRYNEGQIRFPAKSGGDRRIFLDCYGFVEIQITLQFIDGTEHQLQSGYLPVLVKKGTLNDSVKAMADYIYDNQQDLLINGEFKSKNISALKESDYKSFESQIILAEEIATIYEESFGYFKANCRLKVEKANIIDRLEKLQFITPKTLQYTVQHPEHLRQVSGAIGIQISNRTYHPERTMITQNVYSKNIYENRVLVGFLSTMVDSVQYLIKRLHEVLSKLPDNEISSSDYVYSPSYIFFGTKKLLVEGKKRLATTLAKLELLWSLYNHAMQIYPLERVEHIPKPSAIFLSVPEYNKIFIRIHQWFSFGVYDFGKETFMLSFIKISFLYESYVLAKLINFFKTSDFELISKEKCVYPIPERWKYKNTYCNNTFTFRGSEQEITLFYQPVIFDTDKSSVNGIGLYRNNTISINNDTEDERRGHYYVPDFLIKIDTGSVVQYIICDAKFSSLSTIQNYISNLAYKYLFSISPISDKDVISGLCIIYGQCTEANVLQTIYDRQLANSKIAPFAETLPLIEGIQNDRHFNHIKQMLY